MIGRLWRRHPVLTLAFGLALLAVGFFGARALTFAVTLAWRAEQPVAGWMTPRYVQRTYDLPREVVAGILHVDEEGEARMPIDALARAQGRPLDEILAEIEAAVAAQDAQDKAQDAGK